MVACRTRIFLALGLLSLFFSPAWAGQESRVNLTLDDMSTPALRVERVTLDLSLVETPRLQVAIGSLRALGRSWRDIRVQCEQLDLKPATIACRRGYVQVGKEKPWPLEFRYRQDRREVELSLAGTGQGRWKASARWGEGWNLTIDVADGELKTFASLLGDKLPTPSGGTVSGRLAVNGKGSAIEQASAGLTLSKLAFADASGLHAGEGVGAVLKLDVRPDGPSWAWRSEATWQNGEVYWQPLYLNASGQRLNAAGSFDRQQLRLLQGTLDYPGIGSVSAAGTFSRQNGRLEEVEAKGKGLDLGPLYARLVLPWLEKTGLAKTEAKGKLGFEGRISGGAPERLDIALENGSLRDTGGRFSLDGLKLALPWRKGGESVASVALSGGQVLNMPLGPFSTVVRMADKQIVVPDLRVPILGGSLAIRDFHAEEGEKGWQWQFEGGLTPVSMERFSAAMGWPGMHGTLAGVIPLVRYRDGRLSVDGALLVNAFDGTVVLKDLVLLDPLGRAPRLEASLDMRNLDLGLLSRTFSFGSMEGRVDVTVKGLELSNWKPVAFDARVASSPGSYRRRISQRAVQNISALGGGGAAAAIQRSFLGFFEEFGYSRLGLSCVLRNGVCLMDGVAPAPNGYVIVQGGGIPAITVIGYNRAVGWDELIARLQRITQSNTKPIVQ